MQPLNRASHPTRRSLAVALALCAGGIATPSNAQQWTVIVLHPAGATSSEARAISGAQQVGVADNAGTAMLWSGSGPSGISLNPGVEGAAAANGVAAGRQGGSISVRSTAGVGFFSHAALWSGTAQSMVDLHPTDPAVIHSFIYAIDGTTQVGGFAVDGGGTFSAGRPCLWTGTSSSWVDLTPAGYATGEAHGVSGNQQVGATYDTGLGLACMWTGTAESFINLNPVEALFSAATCTDGAHQYGVIGILDPIPGLFPVEWSGDAESFVLLGIDDPENRWGEVHATHGGWQVGYTTDTDGISNERACLWTGQPNTFLDLNQFVPAQYNGSNALGIWRHQASGTSYVVGYADNTSTGQREAIMWVSGPGVNLIVSPAAPANCSAGVGQPLTYSVRVLNAGPNSSGPITLTVDLPPASTATYASAVPAPTNVTPTQLIFNLPAIAGAGAFADVSITLTAAAGGATSTLTATATAAAEVDPTNNAASASSRIRPTPPSSAPARGLISTVATQSNSLIPGGAGRYTTLNHPFASPSGNWWIINGTTDQSAGHNTVIVRTNTAGAGTIVAQQGATVLPHGTLSSLAIGAEVNDSGLVAISGSDNGPAASSGFVATTDGATLTEIARQAGPIPSMPGVAYNDVDNSANIFANGQVGFAATTTPAGNSAYLSNNGSMILARLNVTTPVGASAPINALVFNNTGVWGLAFDATGAHSIYQANINTGAVENDQVIVADGTLVIQEGVTVLPGFSNPVGPGDTGPGNKFIAMGPSGTWFVRGSNIDPHEDWVVRGSGSTIQHVFKVGDPIFSGATETWQEDPVVIDTFFAHAADNSGNYVIGGMTSSPDDFTDSALVYNNTTVLARENDPVDLNGNGLFDDGVYIRSFDADSVAFAGGAVLAVVTLRDADAALCHTNDTSRGQALIKIPLPLACYANCDASTTPPILNINDFICFQSKFASGDPYANCDGSTTAPVLNVNDFICFQQAFATGCR